MKKGSGFHLAFTAGEKNGNPGTDFITTSNQGVPYGDRRFFRPDRELAPYAPRPE
jgi:hypothetical protein